jgi:CRISPR-associated endonuclease Csn1
MTQNDKTSFSGYTLGLDLGPNSIGWALVETEFEKWTELKEDGEERQHVQATAYPGFLDTSSADHPPLGVRIFEAGLDNFNSAKEKALNQSRRDARSARRVHARRNARRKALRNLLIKAGFLPKTEEEREAFYNATGGNGTALNNPYWLRTKGLDEALTPHELGRAIYHFAQRRGFKSNRKSGKEQDDKGMLAEIKGLGEAIQENGCRTLGEYLFKLGWSDDGSNDKLQKGELRIRGRHTRRNMYEDELKLLLDTQEKYHPTLSDLRGNDERPGSIEHAVLFQHPFELTAERRAKAPSRANLHRAPQVKPCALEVGQTCCSKSAWIAQRFRILKEVNNLKIIQNWDWKAARFLTQDERNCLVDLLSQQQKVLFAAMKKELAKQFGTDPQAYFNLEKGGRDDLQGNAIDAKIAVLISKPVWAKCDDDEKHRLRQALLHEEDAAKLLEAYGEYKLDEKKRKQLLAFDPDSGSGYIGYSEKALLKIVPLLEDGLNEYDALMQSYPNRPEANAFTRQYKGGTKFGGFESGVTAIPALPYLQHPDLPHNLRDITNPIVRRGLTEVRKVVNAIVREHGLPDQIVVELARDMKMGQKERKNVSMRNRLRATTRETAALEVEGLGGNPKSGNDILRYLLWVEQKHTCVYSGKSISQSQLFTSALDLDHILPHWQSLDDSQLNKVLCYREDNASKGQRLPLNWLGESSPQYEELLNRVMGIIEANDQERQQKRFEGIKKLGLSVRERAVMYSRVNGAWPQRLKRIMQEEIDTNQFSSRQLNDTRYLSVSVVRFLELLYPPALRVGEKAVRSTRGGLTAELRRHWGLNTVLRDDPIRNAKGEPISNLDKSGRKQRIDHRHHAVDALVVALSSRGTLKKYQDHFKSMAGLDPACEERREMEMGTFPFPWESFRTQAVEHLITVNVSHRVQRKVRGAFHQETFYGQARDLRGMTKPGKYVTRKTLEAMSGKDVKAVRDPVVRKALFDRLVSFGWDCESTALPKDWWRDEVFLPNGQPVRKARVELQKDVDKMLVLGDKQHRHAVKGNNHHIVFVEVDGKKGKEIRAAVVPRVECAGRVRRQQDPAVQNNWEDQGDFLFSLSRKECVLITELESKATAICLLQKVSGTGSLSSSFDICFRDAKDSRPASEGNKSPFARIGSTAALTKYSINKLHLDALGRFHSSND